MPLIDYPKIATLRCGKQVMLRPMRREDEHALLEFSQDVPADDRQFFRDDVANPAVIRRWAETIDFDRMIPILAWVDDHVVSVGTLHRNLNSWSPHVGEIRVVTGTAWRNHGLSTLITRELFSLALSLKLEKVVAQLMECQEVAIKVCDFLGFEREAVLRKHVCDRAGVKHDLIILSQDVESFWSRLEDMIADTERDRSGHYRSAH
jgi:RimJ/RimL family protein N-acetyltransferase